MTDNAGNTLGTARAISLNASVQTFTDAINPTDPIDIYRFSLGIRSSLNLFVNNLAANAKLELLDGGGNLVSVNGVPQQSDNAGTFAESINTILNPGVYYIRVTPVGGASTAYTLGANIQNSIQPDLIWRNYATGGKVLWRMQGTIAINTIPFGPAVTDVNWQIQGSADFTGDSQPDIVWRNQATGDKVIWQMNGDTPVATLPFGPPVPDTNWQIQATADFTGDGRPDIVWRNQANGTQVIWQMNGTTAVATIPLNPVVSDINWRIVAAADFTGDGQNDIVWRNQLTGEQVIWQMNGTTPTATLPIVGPAVPDPNWKIAGAGDFTGEGQPDILWRNQATGVQVIWQMNRNTAISTINLLPNVVDPNWRVLTPFNRVNPPTRLDLAGNAASQAFNLGTVSGSGVYQDFIGPSDPADVYKFTLAAASSFSLNLTGLTQNLDVELLDSNGALLPPASNNAGTTPETLTRNLAAGTYYIRVFQGASNQNSNYALAIAVNNAPDIIAPTTPQFVDQNVSLLIPNVSITDPDAVTSQVTLSTANGVLSLGSTAGLTFSTGDGTTDSTMVFTGSLTAINTALAGLIYRANNGFTGPTTINLAVNDQGNGSTAAPLSDSATIDITVTAVNAAPVITVPTPQVVTEDIDTPLAGIRIDDPDAFNGILTVSLSVVNGTLTLSNTAGLDFAVGDGTADSNLTFSGPLALINTALNNLVYRSKNNFNGADTLTIQVSDNGNTGSGVPLSDIRTLPITVSAGNDAPVITAPATQTVNEDTSLTIVGISVSDIDAGNNDLTVSLSATSGVITLGSTAGLTFLTGDGTADKVLSFSGTLAEINAALNNLVYLGNPNFAGTDNILINVNDNGNTGGINLSDNKTIALTVSPVNDAPNLTVPGALSTTTATNLPISGILVSDVDVVTTPFSFTIAASNGVLSLGSTTGLTFSSGDGNQDPRMTFTGTLTAINNALNTLVYRSLPGFNGIETLTLTVNDNGNTGFGPNLSNTRTIDITIGTNPGVPIYNFGAASFAVAEGNATNTNNTVIAITRSGNISIASSLDVVLSGGTATAGSDYTAGPITINFAAGQTTAFVPIQLLGDTVFEPDETVNLFLANFSNGGTAGTTQATAVLTITNDDQPPAPVYNFSAATYSVNEGNATNTTTVVTLTRSGNTSIASSVDVILAGGVLNPATPGVDFTSGPITVNFAAGQTTQTVSIQLLGDITFEPDETIALSLGNFTNGGTAGNQGTAVLTLLNDDPAPVPVYNFSAATYSAAEGNATNTVSVVVINRSGNTSVTSSVDVVLSGGTAIVGTDYTGGPLTITFNPGETTKTVPIQILGDAFFEPDETINLSLTNFVGGGAAGAQNTAVFTITNDDQVPLYDFSAATYTYAENSAPNTVTVTINRSGNTNIASSLNLILNPGATNPATVGTDFAAGPIPISFAIGETTKTVTIALVDDAIPELDETIALSLANFDNGGTVGTTQSTAILTITNDDPTPIYDFSAATYTYAENSAPNTVTVTINRSGNTNIASALNLILNPGATNPATVGTDFAAGPIPVSFAVGETTKTVTISLVDDAIPELDETIALSLANFDNGGSAGTTQSTAILTITNDDASPVYDFSAANYAYAENSAPGTVTVTINRSGNTNIASTLNLVLDPGSTNPATAGVDFTAGPIPVSFAIGETTKTVTINLIDDTVFEPDETIALSLANFDNGGSAGTTQGTAILTITNDDAALVPVYEFSAATYSYAENAAPNTVTVTINRTGNTTIASTLNLILAPGLTNPATVGTDFAAGPIPVSFAIGETTQTVTITLVDDAIPELDETIALSLANFDNGGIVGTQSTAVLTITNDDPAPVYDFSAATYTYAENSAPNTVTVTINRSGNTIIASTLNLVLDPGATNPATPGVDFTAGPIPVSFAAGQTSQTITIALVDDAIPELDETIALSLANFDNAGTVGTQGTAVLTITNDDPSPVYEFSAATYTYAENSAPGTVTVIINRTGNTNIASTLNLVLDPGATNPATPGIDFTAGPIPVNFAIGDTTQTVTIDLIDDALPEFDETIALSMANFDNLGSAGTQSTAILTITNDDLAPLYNFSNISYSYAENSAANTVTVTLIRSNNTNIASSVDLILGAGANNPATPGIDFTATPITVNFAVGDTTQTITIPIIDDALPEPDEEIALSLANFNNGGTAGTFDTATLIITNDDPAPVYDFSAATYTFAENAPAGTVVVTINRSGNTNIASTLNLVLDPGATNPATPGVDFTAGPIPISFAIGENTKTVTISLIDDTIFEPDETIALSLANFDNLGTVGTQGTAILTITNDDAAFVPVYQFSAATYSFNENAAPNTVTITVTRSGNTTIASTLDLILDPGAVNGATPGVDFTAGPIPVSFAIGETTKTVTIGLIDDPDFEPDETIALSLANFSNGGITGTQATAVLTIVNDDAPSNAPVKDIFNGNSPTDPVPSNLTAVGNTLFFTANNGTDGIELWKSNGTPAGTVMVKDIFSGATGSAPSSLVAFGNTLYFAANDGVNGIELWKSDGTAAGTVLVKDIFLGANGSSPSNLFVVGNTLYFTANNGANGVELWKSDGTTAGTVLVKDINSFGDALPYSFAAINNTLYFFANNGLTGIGLWKSDGTAAGTVQVRDVSFVVDEDPGSLIAVGNRLFFTAVGSTTVGRELWTSDGTTAGTVQVKDINPTADFGSGIANLTSFNGALYFTASDGTGTRLWKSDGTAAGTVQVANSPASPNRLTVVGSTLYFRAGNGGTGELWKSDGTAAGTVLVLDINGSTNTGSNSIDELINFNGTLYFRANDGVNGLELWKSDGTAAGTVLVKDFNPTGSSTPQFLTVVGNHLFLVANDGTTGNELWVI
ncbi:MAG: pre-peptidase C-terminal domain-containing protein [Scytolyngbya sp. HA4215-MV1]|nr:pre-peptidase C-terminal domain-containing protein [Scytolyngbya sp. HA4215-MV1]